jgi:hypothetical protein
MSNAKTQRRRKRKGGEKGEKAFRVEKKGMAAGFLRADDSGFFGGGGSRLGVFVWRSLVSFNPMVVGSRGFSSFRGLYSDGVIEEIDLISN